MKANAGKRQIFDAVDMLTGDAFAPDQEEAAGGVQMIPVDKISAFKNHPFRLYTGERLQDMVESVKEHGILNPVIVRKAGSRYEMLSGHNRQNAAKLAGLKEIPAIVKEDLDDELALVYVIETNLMQRSFTDLLPSEKAAVLQEKYSQVCGTLKQAEIIRELEALNGRTSNSGGHNGHQAKSRDIIAAEYGFSSRNAARVLRINYLIEPFKKMMDENKLALLSAVDLSYLTKDEQQAVWNLADRQGLKVRPKAAQALRKHSGELTEEKITEILDALSVRKQTGNEGIRLKLPDSICEKYFSGMEPVQMTAVVEQALEAWFSGKETANVQ